MYIFKEDSCIYLNELNLSKKKLSHLQLVGFMAGFFGGLCGIGGGTILTPYWLSLGF